MEIKPEVKTIQPVYLVSRAGHVHPYLADISQTKNLVAYNLQVAVFQRLKLVSNWYAWIFA